jgi:hypothetical protein
MDAAAAIKERGSVFMPLENKQQADVSPA